MNRLDNLARGSLAATLARQRDAFLADPMRSLKDRGRDLQALQRFVREHAQCLCDAISADYGHRPAHETRGLEIAPVIEGVDHAIAHLRRWMKPQRRSVNRSDPAGASSFVVAQPIGVVGVIAPASLPLKLALVPLTGILAAGNRAMVKMSEHSGHLAQVLIERIPSYFPPEKVQFFEETGRLGEAFSALRFDHLLFTGSSRNGRAVLAAAARNLCPVTLELGGKSPAIVCDDFPVRTAAERIMRAKCLGAGQHCTSVDHAWVPERRIEEFVRHAAEFVAATLPSLDSMDYASIIDPRSFERLTAALDDARERGARLVPLMPGRAIDRDARRLAPHIVVGAPDESELMQHEVFGPILPLRGYVALDTVIARINAGPRPLAIYPFSRDGTTTEMLINRVMSGGVSVNDAHCHGDEHDLPFGGVGESGMGHYHGQEGFATFSKMRPIYYQGRHSFAEGVRVRLDAPVARSFMPSGR